VSPQPARPRPSIICAQLLAALQATEGRRRRRKRDTTPDAIGLDIKRRLLEGAVHDDPDPRDFEGWLLRYIESEFAPATGPARAMALDVLAEFHLAASSDGFRSWLEQGAPSEDAR
jgi:hypothetical protein